MVKRAYVIQGETKPCAMPTVLNHTMQYKRMAYNIKDACANILLSRSFALWKGEGGREGGRERFHLERVASFSPGNDQIPQQCHQEVAL